MIRVGGATEVEEKRARRASCRLQGTPQAQREMLIDWIGGGPATELLKEASAVFVPVIGMVGGIADMVLARQSRTEEAAASRPS